MNVSVDEGSQSTRNRFLRLIGPGLITACVVIGPGSISTSSKMGSAYGYQLGWVLAIAVVLMMVYMTLGARLGAVASASPGDILRDRVGSWLPLLIGLSVFCISSSYQFGNNLGAAYAFEVFIDVESDTLRKLILTGITAVLNGLAIAFLFAFKDLYRWLERLMAVFVGLMLCAFILNLCFAGFSPIKFASGLIPSIPKTDAGDRDVIAVIGWISTTFITAVAYYQAYLVRQKGWDKTQLRAGVRDARIGAIILALITLMIMATAASVLRGQELADIKDVANQLKPLFGGWGPVIFCVGLFCAAYSSFLVNSMIGGFLLADGLGKGATPKSMWPRMLTATVLLVGWIIALITIWRGERPVQALVLAQAVTVIASPLMGGVLWWLTSRKEVMGENRNNLPTNIAAGFGLAVLFVLSGILIYRLTSPLFS